MNALSENIKKYSGENPFGDYQARNFSDDKICSEFYPTSTFWSLFNEQHEIILGSRGSGKTVLLKMMRNSMLKSIHNARAMQLLEEKHFISLYVPMHLEFVVSFKTSQLKQEEQIDLFQVAFNCLLAQSLISELKFLIKECKNSDECLKLSMRLSKQINDMWFTDNEYVYDLIALEHKVNKVFYSIDENTGDISHIPIIFKKQICTPLLSVKDIISKALGYTDPTWIICIDEAEFLNEPLLRCVNSFFRSDSNRIALKIASLPFYHSTLQTLKDNTFVSNGNDFNYRVIDMKYNSEDFKQVTNRICYKRLSQSIEIDYSETILEDFLGKIGNDDLVDYFREEVDKKLTNNQIENSIISSFPPKKQKTSLGYNNRRKTIYDKYAPIYFLREMYKRSQQGNRKPGWYAGAKMMLRITQGNPRMFINLMNDMFERAKKSTLTPKAQHEVVYKFALGVCKSTKAIEAKGPQIYSKIDRIARKLQEKTHGGYLVTSSSSFIIKYDSIDDFYKNEDWLKLAIAHSRLFVDDDEKKDGLSTETKFRLANVFSVVYWLPMRKDSPTTISAIDEPINNAYIVNTKKIETAKQLSLIEDDYDV